MSLTLIKKKDRLLTRNHFECPIKIDAMTFGGITEFVFHRTFCCAWHSQVLLVIVKWKVFYHHFTLNYDLDLQSQPSQGQGWPTCEKSRSYQFGRERIHNPQMERCYKTYYLPISRSTMMIILVVICNIWDEGPTSSGSQEQPRPNWLGPTRTHQIRTNSSHLLGFGPRAAVVPLSY